MKECRTTKIDEIGRIVLPIGMRRKLDINPGDRIDISLDGHTINITKTDISYIENYIHEIKDIASDSNNITSKEYESLCEILSKLQASYQQVKNEEVVENEK